MSIDELKNEKGVYILHDSEKEIYKIGCSKTCKSRVKSVIKTYRFCGIKTQLEIFNVIYVKNYKLLEKHLHLLAKKFSYQNEWFKCNQDEMNEVLFKIGSLDYYNK